MPEAASLAAANKRVANILSKTESLIPETIDLNLLTESTESELAHQVTTLNTQLTPYFENGQYQEALVILAQLKAPIDAFFDQVMVMVEDDKIKLNRLAILKQLQALFLKVADISLLQL